MPKYFKLVMISILIISQFIIAEETKDIQLSRAPKKIGMDLLLALQQRKSTDVYTEQKIPLETLSVLLWSANGINREDGKHTAPSAFNSQFIKIYAALESGVYLYNPKDNKLNFLSAEDIRDNVGTQDFVKTAPCVLIITADLNKLPAYAGSKESRLMAAHANAGCIGQNIYLAAAALGLGTRYVMFVNDLGLKNGIKLSKEEYPLCIMPVGYPKK